MTESWSRAFAESIETPDGTRLNTLREAVAYLAKTVPKSERDMPAVDGSRDAYLRGRARPWLDVFGANGRHEGAAPA
ncbi:hypothetical protein [Bradyrhizobium sp. AUGA SZCCT0042]|uniref:hypothetical protein n=1 Tax=Bradyrhizobium sp. AUGA SZCCT0042 TaxID=2807651 RepID=UPI001BA5FC3B|nr:hypothetical protein [Bradyrhizobium sp. AUGA SZCCT0042]MBR1302172.1 hypothetical protein [Bradyrhizobium sp. AUGA SZCCT0042]